MKIQQMRQILEICSCKSINKAAQKLYISQSALTSSVNAAEEELGQKIMERSYNGITLTDFGREFVDASRKILAIYDPLLRRATGSEVTQLRISCQYLLFARAIFTDICNQYTGNKTKFRFVEKTRDLVCQDLLDDISELGLITTPTSSRNAVMRTLEGNGLEYHIISTNESCCMVGPKNPLYHLKEDFITMRDLQPYPQIRYELASWIWEKGTFQHEFTYFPHTGSLSISDSGSFHNFLMDTNGYFIGIYNAKAYQQTKYYDNTRVLKIVDASFPYDTSWLQRRDASITPIALEYLRQIYAAVGKVLDITFELKGWR